MQRKVEVINPDPIDRARKRAFVATLQHDADAPPRKITQHKAERLSRCEARVRARCVTVIIADPNACEHRLASQTQCLHAAEWHERGAARFTGEPDPIRTDGGEFSAQHAGTRQLDGDVAAQKRRQPRSQVKAGKPQPLSFAVDGSLLHLPLGVELMFKVFKESVPPHRRTLRERARATQELSTRRSAASRQRAWSASIVVGAWNGK